VTDGTVTTACSRRRPDAVVGAAKGVGKGSEELSSGGAGRFPERMSVKVHRPDFVR
jgi:hypothetical protein